MLTITLITRFFKLILMQMKRLSRFHVPFWLSNILVYLFYFYPIITSVPVGTEKK